MNHRQNLRVLLVEDDPEDAQIFRRHAGRCQVFRIEVDHAADCARGQAYLEDGNYDLLFLDMHLQPGLSGLEALAQLRRLAPDLPIIVLTGTHAVRPAVEMIRNGAVDYLLKDSFGPSVLERSIRYALEEQRLTRERQEAHEALRRSESRFRSLFNGIPDIVLVHDRHGVILHVNDVGARRLGWSQPDLVGVSLQSIMAPEFADGVEQRAQRALDDGVFGYSAAYLSRTGRRIEVEVNQRRIEFEDRPAVLSVGRDVTERRHADRAFRESAGRFHSVLQSFRDVAYRWVMRRGTFSYVSPSVEDLLGLTPAQLISMGARKVYRRIHPDDARRYREQTESLLRHPGEDRPECLAEYRIRHADGHYVWVSDSRNVTTDKAGCPTAVVGSVRDVTSRHRAEEAIRQSGQQLEAALRQVPEWVYVKGRDLRYLYVNEPFATARGRTPEEMIGKSDYDLFPAEIARRFRSEDRRIIESGRAAVLQGGQRRDGADEDRAHRWTKIPVEDGRGDVCALVAVCGSPARQRRVEQMLLHWAALTRSSADGILGVSVEGTVLSWNPGAEKLYGYSADEVCGRSVALLDPDGADGKLLGVVGLAANGEPVRDYETVHVTSEGAAVQVALSMAPLMGTDGEVTGVSIIARDIAERKEAEERLRASERKYRTTLNAMGDAIHVVDRDLRIVLVNPALGEWLRELGLEEPTLGRTVREQFPFLPERVEDEYERVFRTGDVLRREENTEVNGQQILTESRKVPVIESGRVAHVLTIVRDVTEHRRAQKALQESEMRYRELWDEAPAAYHIIDKDGVIQRVNQTELDMLGYTAEEVIGRSIFDFIRPDQRQEARQRFQAKLAGRPPPKAVNRAYVRKDGSEFYVSIDDVMERDADGNVVSIRSTMVDVTEQVELRERLRASEERFRLLVNTVFDGINITELDPGTGRRKLLYCNDRFVEMSGYSREELMAAEDLNELGVSYLSEQEERRNRDLFLQGLPTRGTASWKRPDGKDNILEWSAVAVPMGGKYHIFGVDRDITERVRAEEEQRRLEEQVRRTQKLESLGVLAGGIAHDFNNLLTGVLGNAGLALADLPPDSPTHYSLRKIEEAAQSAAELANQMLAYSGKASFMVGDFDLSAVIKEMRHLLEAAVSEHVTLRLHLAENLPSVQGDPVQVKQIAMNLITNASEAIGEESGVVTLVTELVQPPAEYFEDVFLHQGTDADQYVALRVSDTGCGIDEGMKVQVFDPFFTTKFSGRGLGLAAVLGIVRAHGGSVKVDSIVGEGTTFEILFPVGGAPGPKEEDDQQAPRKLTEGGGTVVVVDDEETVRTVASRMLEQMGFAAEAVSCGETAVRLLREGDRQVVAALLDLTMPRMDGWQTMDELRQVQPGLPVVLCSAYGRDTAGGDLSEDPKLTFMQKPFSPDKLRRALARVLATNDASNR